MKDEYGLTLKQRRFADFYLETGNATESYVNAGYGTKKGKGAESESFKILRKPSIQAYIQKISAEKDSERIASQDEVLQFLTSVMRGETSEEIIGFSMHGETLRADKKPNLKDQVKAAELLGKRYLLFTEQQKIDLTNRLIFEDNIPESD